MNWQRKIDKILMSNNKFSMVNGKRTIVHYITFKDLEKIKKQSSLPEGILLNYVKKNGGILIPYKKEDIPFLKELAQNQEKASTLQEFEKKKCRDVVDELLVKHNGEIPDEVLLNYGFQSPAEVVYAFDYREKLINQEKPKTMNEMMEFFKEQDESSLEPLDDEEIEILVIDEPIKDKKSKELNLEGKIKKEVEKILKSKEKKVVKDFNALRRVGNVKIVTDSEIKHILEKLELDPSDKNKEKIDKIIAQIRNERVDILLKDAANIYNDIIKIIEKNLNVNDDYFNRKTELTVFDDFDKVFENSDEETKQRLENLKDKYDEIRNVVFFYHEQLIKWAAYEVKNNSYEMIDTSNEDIIEIMNEYFLNSYFTYIKKYFNEDNPSSEHRLATYFINRAQDNFKVTRQEVLGHIYAGRRLKEDLKKLGTTDMHYPMYIMDKAYSYQNNIAKIEQMFEETLHRKPTVEELAEELGESKEKIYEMKDIISLLNGGLESLEEIRGKNIDQSYNHISQDMEDSFRESYKTIFGSTDGENLEEHFVIPMIEDGVLVEHDDEDILGYDNSLFANVLSEEYKEKLRSIVDALPRREKQMIEYRFGLNDGHPRTLEEIAKVFDVTRERIRQIESKILVKLRHPRVSGDLNGYYDVDRDYYDLMESSDNKKKR